MKRARLPVHDEGGQAGLFEIAHGGTLFLDEKRRNALALTNPTFARAGGKSRPRVGGRSRSVDVRVIGATRTIWIGR